MSGATPALRVTVVGDDSPQCAQSVAPVVRLTVPVGVERSPVIAVERRVSGVVADATGE